MLTAQGRADLIEIRVALDTTFDVEFSNRNLTSGKLLWRGCGGVNTGEESHNNG